MRTLIAATVVVALCATAEAGQTRRYTITQPPAGVRLYHHYGCHPGWRFYGNVPTVTRGIGPDLTPPPLTYSSWPSLGPSATTGSTYLGPSSTTSSTYTGNTYTGPPQLIINPFVDQTGYEHLGKTRVRSRALLKSCIPLSINRVIGVGFLRWECGMN